MSTLPDETAARRFFPYCMGVVALLPLAWHWESFSGLFWFGDEWGLLAEIQEMGFWRWLIHAFAENFVPLFKVMWGGSVYLFGGSYQAMLVVLWLCHALVTIQLGRLLRTHAFPTSAILLTQTVFGLTSINIETLAWTVQGSAVLALLFMLAGMEWQARHPVDQTGAKLAAQWPLLLWSALSALSFARGVITGAILAAGCFWPETGKLTAGGFLWRRRLLCAGFALAPAVLVAALIKALAAGNHQHLAGKLGEIVTFGFHYFCLNPCHRFFDIDSLGRFTVILLGLAKLSLYAWGLRHGSHPQRRLLVLLITFDLANAALLGIGRYHTGIDASVSSRYQYGSLICLLPFAGLYLDHLGQRLKKIPASMRTAACALALAGASLHFMRAWSVELKDFVYWRGTETRRLLLQDPNPPAEGAVPGIPFMRTDRAKELLHHYKLK